MIKGIIKTFDRDTILHLRIPFSFFLFPVFVFGISQSTSIHLYDTLIYFISLHLFIYPASNIYNSYMDKDTGSIGGLRNPPPVTEKLYRASLFFDFTGMALCAISGWRSILLMTGYIAFSKAYSWHGIRLKKYAFLSWASIAFFQGGYVFMIVSMVAEHNIHILWFDMRHIACMLVAALFIGGSYPLTQIYQHKEDRLRGDKTISSRLGIKGTFIFTFIMFLFSGLVLFGYFNRFYSTAQFMLFLICLSPVLIYLLYWFLKTRSNSSYADFDHTMLMNKISAVCMVICFGIIMFLNQTPVVR